MTSVDLSDSIVSLPRRRLRWLVSFGRLLTNYRRFQAERQTLLTLSRLNPHLLRDIGIEPQDVVAAIQSRNALHRLHAREVHD